MVRFDDHADGPDGTRLYANRTVLVMRTKWGRVVDHEDFYVDTGAIVEFDRTLTELGVTPIPKQRECAASRPRDRRGRPLAGIDRDGEDRRPRTQSLSRFAGELRVLA